MKRTALTLTLALLFGCIGLAWSQTPAQRVIIMDSTGTHAAAVSGGNLSTAGGSSDTINVFHQSTIRHVSSVTHIAGTVRLSNVAGTVVTVTGTSLDVNCTGCSAASVVNVDHVSGAMHIAGTILGARLHVQGLGIPGQAHGGVLTIQGVTGMIAVSTSAAQSGEWNIRHISSVTHIGGTGNAGAIHVSGYSNIGSGAAGGTTTPMPCHTRVAFSTTADLVLAHSQNAWRIYICSVIIVSAAAENISIVEGSGTACATGLRGIIGGFGGTMALAANGGFSSISGIPWIASEVNGNPVCLDKSGSGTVSGTITYRGAP